MIQTKDKIKLLNEAINAAELTLKGYSFPLSVEYDDKRIIIENVGSDYITYTLKLFIAEEKEDKKFIIASITYKELYEPYTIVTFPIDTGKIIGWKAVIRDFLEAAKPLYFNLKLDLVPTEKAEANEKYQEQIKKLWIDAVLAYANNNVNPIKAASNADDIISEFNERCKKR